MARGGEEKMMTAGKNVPEQRPRVGSEAKRPKAMNEAKRLKGLNGTREGKKPRYPWERWFAQTRFTLLRGVDFHCSTSSMTQLIRQNASNRRKGVLVKDGGDRIDVQIFPRGKAPRGAHPALSQKRSGQRDQKTGCRG